MMSQELPLAFVIPSNAKSNNCKWVIGLSFPKESTSISFALFSNLEVLMRLSNVLKFLAFVRKLSKPNTHFNNSAAKFQKEVSYILHTIMVKIFVRFLRRVLRVVIWMEQLVWRCVKLHRVRIVQIIHPLLAVLMLLTVGFFAIYELCYILPECSDVSGVYYKLHCLLILFFIYNIVGNMWKCWMTDTSFLSLPPNRLTPTPAEAPLWHLCTFCQMLVPPRAWHCRLCNCCMLKRDHHCNVTANCIGHANQRYFIGFLLHLWLGSCTAIAYNVYHLFSQKKIVTDPIYLLSLAMDMGQSNYVMHSIFKSQPLDPSTTWLIITSGILKLNVIAAVLVTTHLVMQLLMVYRGSCLYYIKDRSYDLGFWNNMQTVLGKRMFWIVLSPFISSPLPHDGTQWLMPSKTSGRKPV